MCAYGDPCSRSPRSNPNPNPDPYPNPNPNPNRNPNPSPPLPQANLSHSLAVRDEWLDTLALHHADSLRRLDLTECQVRVRVRVRVRIRARARARARVRIRVRARVRVSPNPNPKQLIHADHLAHLRLEIAVEVRALREIAVEI